MDSFYLSLSMNDIATASYYYNQIAINDRVSLFLSVLSKRNDNLTESLLPLTPSSIAIVEAAIWYGNYTVVSRLFLDEYRDNKNLIIISAMVNNVNIMQFLHQRGCVWSCDSLYLAVIPSYDCLKYAVEVMNMVIDQYIFSLATKRTTYRYYGMPAKIDASQYSKDEVRVLQYLHDKGCVGDWDCRFKARQCHFCLSRSDIQLQELWYMEEEEYKSSIQWLPREILEDIVGLL